MEQLIPRSLRIWENVSSNLARSVVFSQFQSMTKGHLTLKIQGDSSVYSFGYGNKIKAEIEVKNDRFFQRFWADGELGFGESYVAGDWESPDLSQVIRWFFLNGDKIEATLKLDESPSPFLHLLLGVQYLQGATQSKAGASRANWASRYELERPFYSLMLDENLNNSGAYFDENDSLAEAQVRKYRAIAQELRIFPGCKILELGCGWGGFALYLAKHFDCHVTAVTLSQEQTEFLKQKVSSFGYEHKITVLHSDYRRVEGRFDRIVSIEMIDLLETSELSGFFERCDKWLNPGGVMVHQLLLSPEFKKTGGSKESFQNKHITLGLKRPSLRQILAAMGETSDFCLRHLEDRGQSYSKTLHNWSQNFRNNLDQVASLGFDQTFTRSWQYYLAYAEAAFEQGLMTSVQLTLSRSMERT